MKSGHFVTPPLALLALPGIAAAHTGHGAGGGFAAGLVHPLGGLDHLLTMLTVGLRAVTQVGALTWQAPLAFVSLLLAGALHLIGCGTVVARWWQGPVPG